MTNIPKTLESKWAIHAHGKMKNLYRFPHLLKKDEKMEFMQNFTTVTFARHPFVRLVSTFKDKIIDHDYNNWRSMVKYDENKPYKVYIIEALGLSRIQLAQ